MFRELRKKVSFYQGLVDPDPVRGWPVSPVRTPLVDTSTGVPLYLVGKTDERLFVRDRSGGSSPDTGLQWSLRPHTLSGNRLLQEKSVQM